MRRFCLFAAALSASLVGCADGGTLSPRDRKPPLSVGDAGPPARDSGAPDAGQPPPPPPPPPRDAGLPSLEIDAGSALPQPIDAGPLPDAGGPPDAGPIAPEPPSCGVPPEGACDGTVAIWCGAEGVEAYDCADDGLDCGYDPASGYWCVAADPPPDDPCGGVDYLGECRGQLVRWCDGEALTYRDCGSEGLRCAWVDAETGYWCVP